MRIWFKKQQDDAGQTAAVSVPVTEGGEPSAPVPASPAPATAREPAPVVPQPPPSGAEPVAASAAADRGAYKSDHRSLYKQLLAGLYDAVLVTDPKGHIIDINARVTEFFSYSREETWDLPISELLPGVNTALISRIRQGLSGERFVLIDGRCYRKDRSTFAAEIAISSIDLMNDGDLVFSIRNVERRHVQMQRLKSCHSLLNHMPLAAAACDPEARIRVANVALARLLGYEKVEDLQDKPVSVIWNEAGSADVIRRVLAGETWKEAVQVVNASGMRLQLTLSLAPEMDARKKVIGFLVAFSPASVVALGASSAKTGGTHAGH